MNPTNNDCWVRPLWSFECRVVEAGPGYRSGAARAGRLSVRDALVRPHGSVYDSLIVS